MLEKGRIILLAVLACLSIFAVSARPDDIHSPIRKHGMLNQRRGIFSDVFGGIVKRIGKGIEYIIESGTMLTISIGKRIISPPLNFIEYKIGFASDLTRFGIDLSKRIVRDARGLMSAGWKNVKAINFPGKDIVVLFYPTGLISVVSDSVDAVLHLAFKSVDLARSGVKAILAYTIYATLRVVVTAFDVALKRVGDCLALPNQDLKVKNIPMISTVKTSKGEVCGINNLSPSYNVTITRNDKKFLIIEMPFTVPQLMVRFHSITAGQLIENEPLDIEIRKVKVKAEIRFQSGTILKFVRFHIRLAALEDFKMEFRNQKSRMMELVENLSGVIGQNVEKEINKFFKKLESLVYNEIEEK